MEREASSKRSDYLSDNFSKQHVHYVTKRSPEYSRYNRRVL